MQVHCSIAALATMLWATSIFSYDISVWENAIKNSDLTFFDQITNVDNIDAANLQGLIALADEVIKARASSIFERKCRVYTSIGLKLLPFTALFPIVGYILDQRALGAILGIYAFTLGAGCTAVATVGFAQTKHPILATASAILGGVATLEAVAGCVKLERWLWHREHCSCNKLETAYQDAIAIKGRLSALAAKIK